MHPHYKAIIEAYAAAGRPYFHQVSADEAKAFGLVDKVLDKRPDDTDAKA